MWVASLLVVACLACGARSTAHEQRCTSAREANELQGGALQRNEKRYQAELAGRGLTPAVLTMHRWQLAFEMVERERTPVGVVEERETHPRSGRPIRVVMFGEQIPNCYSGSPPELVRDGSKIFRAVRAPRVTTTTTVVVCGESCNPTHGTFLCGGAQMAPEAIGYELPEGTSYEGDLPIEFEAEQVELTGKPPTRDCPSQQLQLPP